MVGLAALLAALQLGPMLWAPGDYLVGNHVHPDNLANQWLLPWAAEAVASGESLLHTEAYYWPVGDAPLLSGDGTQAALYAPLHWLVGWPRATPLYVGLVLLLNGLGAAVFARAAGARGGSVLVATAAVGVSPYVLMELSAGRFSQAAVYPLGLFLGAWLWLLRAPSVARAVLAALALAWAAFSYWYYGWFGVLAGAVLWAVADRRPWGGVLVWWRWHAVFAGVFLAVLSPWAALFFGSWESVPGVAETIDFPPDSALRDRIPWLLAYAPGDPATTAALTAVPVGLLAVWGAWRRGGWVVWGLCGVCAVFFGLGVGPVGEFAPYTVLYGLSGPLRRFWWPMRHGAVLYQGLAVLAALGLSRAKFGHTLWAGLAGALVVVGSLWLQGAPLVVEHTALSVPPPGVAALAELPPGVVLGTPLAPAVTGANDHLLHQLMHKQPIVSGHSPWVDKARPAAWDAWVASHPFLGMLVELETAGHPGGVLAVDRADIERLEEAGVRYVVLDRTLYPLALRDLVRAEGVLFDALFGRPVVRTADTRVWALSGYTGAAEVAVPAVTWPPGLVPGGPEHPMSARRFASPMLGPPSSRR